MVPRDPGTANQGGLFGFPIIQILYMFRLRVHVDLEVLVFLVESLRGRRSDVKRGNRG